MSSSNFGVKVAINLGKGLPKIEEAIRQGVADYGVAILMPKAKELSPVNHEKNRDSIEFVMLEDKAGKIQGQLQTSSGYGGWLEIGTGLFGPAKHRIVPVNSKFLSWIDEETGKRITVRSTKGMQAKPYMKPALDATKSELKPCILAAVRSGK